MYERILELATSTKAINTHSHHQEDEFFESMKLEKLLGLSYVSWCGIETGKTNESREYYLNKVKYKSYFKSLQYALKKLYNVNEDLTAQNWEMYSDRISEAHKDSSWHKSVLANQCNYEKSILDAYWDPGSDNDNPELFVSTFRIDSLFYGFDLDESNHNGKNAYNLYGNISRDIDEYMDFVRRLITEKLAKGCVSLKSAMAYDRNLCFTKTTKQQANKVFVDKNYSKDDVTAFQNYFFFEVCVIAAELGVPIQCHTGLGCLDNTRAIQMREVIVANPETKFVLFHAGFPWCDDILALLHACRNVHSDICWLPLLSPTVAEDMLHKLIEVGTSDKICWGCDTWTSEESYGARILINEVLASALSCKIDKGYLNIDEAENIVQNVLYNNPKTLYKI